MNNQDVAIIEMMKSGTVFDVWQSVDKERLVRQVEDYVINQIDAGKDVRKILMPVIVYAEFVLQLGSLAQYVSMQWDKFTLKGVVLQTAIRPVSVFWGGHDAINQALLASVAELEAVFVVETNKTFRQAFEEKK